MVRGFRLGQIPKCYVTKFAPDKAFKLITRGMLSFDERVVLRRVVTGFGDYGVQDLGIVTCKHARVQGLGLRVEG